MKDMATILSTVNNPLEAESLALFGEAIESSKLKSKNIWSQLL